MFKGNGAPTCRLRHTGAMSMSTTSPQPSGRPRWFTATAEDHSRNYLARFRELAAAGEDVTGEARFVDMMAGRGARVLDAGCGGGRIAGALAEAGHRVYGVDVDPVLVAGAREDHPGPEFAVVDLTELDLAHVGGDPVDVTVCAGNVMVFLTPGTEREVVRRLLAVTRPGGRVVLGFRREEVYPFETFEADLAALGVVPEFVFGSWHLDPVRAADDYRVTVLRVPTH